MNICYVGCIIETKNNIKTTLQFNGFLRILINYKTFNFSKDVYIKHIIQKLFWIFSNHYIIWIFEFIYDFLEPLIYIYIETCWGVPPFLCVTVEIVNSAE